MQHQSVESIQHCLNHINAENLSDNQTKIKQNVKNIRTKRINEFLLGQGTYGEIVKLNENYVIKVVKIHPKENTDIKNKILNEAMKEYAIMRSLGEINHGNFHVVKPVGDIILDNDSFSGFVLEKYDHSLQVDIYSKTAVNYNRNALLFQLLSKPKNGLRILQSIFEQISLGVYHIHQHNIAHFDLKLENILIKNIKHMEEDSTDVKCYVAITDFGFSEIQHFDQPPNTPIVQEEDRHELATPHYRAPELFLEFGKYGFEVDIWSLGVIGLRLMEIFIYSHTACSQKENRCLFPLLLIHEVCSKEKSYLRKCEPQDYAKTKIEIIRRYYDIFYQIGIYDTNLYNYHLEKHTRKSNDENETEDTKKERLEKSRKLEELQLTNCLQNDTSRNIGGAEEEPDWWKTHFQKVHDLRQDKSTKFEFYNESWKNTTVCKLNEDSFNTFEKFQRWNNRHVRKNLERYDNTPVYSFTEHIKPAMYHLCGNKGKKLFFLVASLLEFNRCRRPTITEFAALFNILYKEDQEQGRENKKRRI